MLQRQPTNFALALLMTALLPGLFAPPATAAEPHPFSIHDMLAMERIGSITVSPDHQHIAFTRRVTDLDKNGGRTNIWLINKDGSGLRSLTNHTASSVTPAWSADGKHVYFLSARSGSMQLWRIAIDGGEAEQVTSLPVDINDYVLSPTGTHVATAIEVFPDANGLADTKARLDQHAARKDSGMVYDKLFVRHWDTWKDGRRSHLFVLPLSNPTADNAIDVMKGMDADCPSKPFGGHEEFTFSPDGKQVVFAARNAGREEAWSTNLDLYAAPINGTASPVSLTSSNPALDNNPVFSPDGKTLAYLAMERAGYEADKQTIMLLPWANGAPAGSAKPLTTAWDRSAASIAWSHDSSTIFTHAADVGKGAAFAIDVRNENVTPLTTSGYVTEITTAGDHVVYGHDHLRSPVEIFTAKLNGSDVRQITHINKGRVAATIMGEPEQFSFAGWNNETVYGWVIKPINFNPSKKYPVAFLIHGGPQGSFGDHFHYRWNPQVYAARGYAAVMIDFHGSTGYGQAFCDSIRGDWGGKPYEDLKLGLEATLKKYPWMDGERVAALGASFGGYMINWIAGNWPDRFRCLVNHDGNIDERMAYYDTEELWFPEWDHMGTPWDNPENFSKHNPIDHVSKWKTPMLVIHGALDYRVVDTQGLSTFTALQRRGIPSRLLYFPDENHWVLKPHNSILWHNTVLDWLDQWTK